VDTHVNERQAVPDSSRPLVDRYRKRNRPRRTPGPECVPVGEALHAECSLRGFAKP